MRIVVEGSGMWAMAYLTALRARVGPQDGVFFTYDSTFGLDRHVERLHARMFADYLAATLRNVDEIGAAGFAAVDVKDTVFQGRANPCRDLFPHDVDAVFVVTPDRTHCDVAERWLGRARRIFVEKPFDVSADRIRRFCAAIRAQSTTEVFALDHYFVRCNQVAADEGYFTRRLLARTDSDDRLGDFSGFEFVMTEPPRIVDGQYDGRIFRDRALSLQGGLVFDMGAHAIPLLIPFFDLRKGIELRDVWAGRCDELRDVVFSGAETFSIANVECRTRRTRTKRTGGVVTGRFIIGKDVGQRPCKRFTLTASGGAVRFDLTNFRVDHTGFDGTVTPIAPLYQDWIGFLVAEILEGRVPRAVQVFRPNGAVELVDGLERWRDACQRDAQDRPRLLPEYAAGTDVSALQTDRYRTLRAGERL